ncbi:MAG: hypothetical protein ACRD0W_18540 [Acidimicrobiales bacterium]
MTRQLLIENIQEALVERLFPTVTVWNRVEPRPRSIDFGRALRAEVRDALWMLARQWQLGEFFGDDAGSAVTVKYCLATTQLTRFRPDDAPTTVPLDATLPLESVVERRAVPFSVGADLASLDLRLVMGRQWLRLVREPLRDPFAAQYPIAVPDPDAETDVELVSHPEVWATLQAVAERAMDGYLLYAHLVADPANRAYDGMSVPPGDEHDLDEAAERFVRWFDNLVARPDVPSWDPQRLEHRFAVAAPSRGSEKVLTAAEFPGGHLDWHAFSVDAGAAAMGTDADAWVEGVVVRTVLPTPVAYDGMPDPRYWAFEDGRTSFAGIRADTTDLARLLFTQFGLVFSNDWLLVPCDLEAGSVASVRGVAVTNVFGERLWVEPAGSGRDEDWQRWAMFTLDVTGAGQEAADTSLLLLPAVPKTNEGPPLEEVMLVRDEVANMVWGIERTVPVATGDGRRGAETAAESLAWRQRLVGPAPAPPMPPAAPIRYRVMNTVPEQWIPFVPVHVDGSNREVQLQRAAMPRILPGDPRSPRKARPRTSVLRVGLDSVPAQPYFVHEEEVLNNGTAVKVSFRRTRWTDGRVVVWLAAHRMSGRGQASSGLAFDSILPTGPAST